MERQIKIALAGNPNSGKTTLFNALTGSNQFVGNWPGVTVLPGVKPRSSRCFFISGEPPTLRMSCSVPVSANINGIMSVPPFCG